MDQGVLAHHGAKARDTRARRVEPTTGHEPSLPRRDRVSHHPLAFVVMGDTSHDEPRLESLGETGGDEVCWAHLLCEECGMVLNERNEHRPGCSAGREERD